MKKLTLLLVTVVIAAVTFAQTKTKVKKVSTNLSLGITGAKVSGDISDTHSNGIGSIAQVIFSPDSSNFSYTITSGIITFNAKEGAENFNQIPLLVGFRYHYDVCYSGFGAGLSFFDKGRENQFTYSLLMGLKLSKALNIDGRYMLASKEHKNIASFNVTLAFVL
jgi:hypothetical protein